MAVPLRKPIGGRLFMAARAAALCAGVCSCSLILGLQPLEITNWYPRNARIAASAVSDIWVEFSTGVDATKAEQALSLSENGAPMAGSYSWRGNRLVLTPARPVSPGNDYEIAVVSTAETKEGNSLAKDFRFAFTTKTESGRPTVLSTQPADGSRVAIPLSPIVVSFSEPIDQASFIAAFSVSPDPGGTLSFDVTGAIASFTPLSAWIPGTEYNVVISEAVKDLSGNRLPAAVRFRFTAGAEEVRPTLVAVRPTVSGVPQGAGLTPEDPGDSILQVNTGFETTWGIELQFSEPVSRENIESFIDLQPGWSFQIDPAGAPRDRFVLVPEERFIWGTFYCLTIKRGVLDTSGNASATDAIYSIRADGPATKPPRVEVVRFRTNPADSVSPACDQYATQDSFANLNLSNFTPGVDEVSYFDLYLSLADGAAADPFSIMHSFSVAATNGAALISPVAVAATSFPDPQPATITGLTPVRVSVNITNTTNSGVVTLAVSNSLTDTAGNRAATAFSLPLLK
jgi:hypothetical protein